jgi:hypothetical protein
MSDPDDVIKLNAGDLLGDDFNPAAESASTKEFPSLEVNIESEEIPRENDIKFNDLTNKPSVAPMVRMQKKGMRGVVLDLGMGNSQQAHSGSEPTGQIRSSLNPEKTSRPSIESESSFKLIQRGKSSKTSEPPDYFKAYDRFRAMILEGLKDSVGPRKTCAMLVKTFEAAREKFPDVFRNANWDANGNLLDDGSLNANKMLENRNALDSKQPDVLLDTALNSLLNLRLQAIEKGLGADTAHIIKDRLKKWADEGSRKEGYGVDDPKFLKRLSDYFL